MIIAFSMYSRIPMPIFKWEEKDMKHIITFLPFIGALIGVVEFIVIKLQLLLNLPCMVMTLLMTLIPILVTGGFHLDGFMDVQDALRSYQSKEKKLEIMKDPHIGAFAVIGLVSLGLIFITSLYLIIDRSLVDNDFSLLYIYSAIFALVRSSCGITCLIFGNAKKDGMLNMETDKAGKGDMIFLMIQALICLTIMALIWPVAAIVCAISTLIYTTFYKRQCEKNFGGVTGDTSGYYIVSCECVLTVVLAILSFWR